MCALRFKTTEYLVRRLEPLELGSFARSSLSAAARVLCLGRVLLLPLIAGHVAGYLRYRRTHRRTVASEELQALEMRECDDD